MAKSYKYNQDNEKRIGARNLVAYGMIAASTGKGGPMRDRRERRPKDARRSWKNEEHA